MRDVWAMEDADSEVVPSGGSPVYCSSGKAKAALTVFYKECRAGEN